MLKTQTLITCDGCGDTIIGDTDGHANREANALAAAREIGWRRVRQDSLKDYCLKCVESNETIASALS